jgi:hypothetical protein
MIFFENWKKMNTYNIEVNGKTILTKIPTEELEENLKLIRGLVWTSGGNNDSIFVSLNKEEDHCSD